MASFTAEHVAEKSGEKKKSSYIRVGREFKSEAKIREKLRGNTGGGEKMIMPGDGVKLPLFDGDGKPRVFLPSEAWIDAHFHEIEDKGPDGDVQLIRYFDRTKKSPRGGRHGNATLMIRCPQCRHVTPPLAMEVPWRRRSKKNPAMELLCALTPATPASLAVLADDLKMGLARVHKLLAQLRRPFGLMITRDADGVDWVFVPARSRAQVRLAGEAYWDSLRDGLTRPEAMTPVCADCREPRDHRLYGASSSASAIRELQRRNLVSEESRLPLETKSALRREIKQFKSGKWRPNNAK